MTVQSTKNKIQHIAYQDQTDFVFDFTLLLEEDMRVSVDYEDFWGTFDVIIDPDSNGGTVQLSEPIDSGRIVILYRYMAATQEVDYKPYDKFPAETHERALDKLTLLIQQLNDFALGAIRFPLAEAYGPNSILPPIPERALKYVFFDVDGGVTVSDGTAVGGDGVKAIHIKNDGWSPNLMGVDPVVAAEPEIFIKEPNTPNRLVTLDPDGKLPESVFPPTAVLDIGVSSHSVDLFEIDKTDPQRPLIGADQPVNSPLSLLQLDSTGKIPAELINVSGLTNLGLYRGDDLCPKYNDLPGDCTAPDTRNPSQRMPELVDYYESGHYFIITMADGELSGTMSLKTELGEDTDSIQTVEAGDGILFIEEVEDPNAPGTILIHDGWYLVADIVGAGSAEFILYDPTDNKIILPQDTNVQLAIERLDSNVLPLAGGSMTGHIVQTAAPTDPNHLVNKAYADSLSSTLEQDITNLETAVDNLDIRLTAAETDISSKIEATDYATPTTGGTLKVRLAGANAYFSTTDTNP